MQDEAPACLLDTDDASPHLLPGVLEDSHEALKHRTSKDPSADQFPGLPQLLGLLTLQLAAHIRLDLDDLLKTGGIEQLLEPAPRLLFQEDLGEAHLVLSG